MESPYVFEQVYKVPIAKVWQALSDRDAMKVWYFPQLNRFEAAVGFHIGFEDDDSAFKKEWVITQITMGKKLAHSWSYVGHPGTSEVVFELFEVDAGTLLRLTHTGLDSFPSDPHFERERFEQGWKSILGVNLKRFLR